VLPGEPASGTSYFFNRGRVRHSCRRHRAEDSPTAPINPYGTSKLMSEWMLRDLGAATALRYVVLRYFNVAGSDPGGRIGQSTINGTLLTKVACEGRGRQAPARVDLRHRLSDARRHRCARLHPRRGSRRCHLKALDYLRRAVRRRR
jgi:UDP-glucose 4-epimerase